MQDDTRKYKSRTVQSLLDKFKNAGLSDGKGEFKFPPPPPIHEPRLSPAIHSDSSDSQPCTHGKRIVRSAPTRQRCQSENDVEKLPPIGVFWDIENCQIPHGKSALTIVQSIRNTFFDEYREAEFTVVCDVHKESPLVIQELNDAQVDLLHVISSSKNAADEKLRQAIRRFADLHGSPSAVLLLTSDINFAPDLSDLRHRKKIHVILLHSSKCSDSLIMCANEHYNFSDFVQPLPHRNRQIENQSVDIFVWNLPTHLEDHRIRGRLKALSQNCSGRIIVISGPIAVLRFPTLQMAMRAQKRMDGENVLGHAIRVGVSHLLDSPVKMDNSYISRTKGRDMNSCGYNGNHSSIRIAPYQSSFLPINPSPWISSNGASASSYGSQCKPVRTQAFADFKENLPSPVAVDSSPRLRPTKEGPKNEILDGTQTVMNVMEKRSVSNGGAVTSKKPVYSERYNHSSNEIHYSQQKALNALSQDHRDWADNLKKRARTSPINCTLHPASSNRKSLESGWNPVKSIGNDRRCRTPSPYFFNSRKSLPLSVKPSSQNPANASHPSEGFDKDKYFSPISSSCSGIELHVTNLDQMVDPTEMKKMLINMFSEHTRVLNLFVFVQADQTFAASVRVSTLQDAQLVISRLHRRKVGSKRMLISHAQSNYPHNLQNLEWQTVSLLQDVPQNSILLFKFLKMFEARYMTSLNVSDLFRLKYVCEVTDEDCGRMVTLNKEYIDALGPAHSSVQEVQFFCAKHYKTCQTNGVGWAEQAHSLPNVMVPLANFAANIRKLLSSHNNVLPMASLCICYNAEFDPLEVDENGVPLEHYVTCVSHVELTIANNGVKYLRPSIPKNVTEENTEECSQSLSPSLVGIVSLFEREVVDLLKTQPHSRLLFNKFIPAYHHHFGRQCRVADYGFVKLINLLEAIPNVVQVIGEGNQRSVTLSHRAQIRRFTSELFRILKSQPMRKLSLFELPATFERTVGRALDPVDYGMCSVNDLVQCLLECSVITIEDNVLSPFQARNHSDQSPEEIKRTKKFARQLDEDAEGRRITLTDEKRIEVLSSQVIDLIYPSFPQGIPLSQISSRYLWHHGYTLSPSTYNAATLEELLNQLTTVKVVDSDQEKLVVPLEGALLKQIACRVKAFLINSDTGRLPLGKLRSHFSVYHERYLSPMKLLDNLPGVIQFEEEDDVVIVELTPLYQFVRQLVKLISASEGRMLLNKVEEAYVKEYNTRTNPAALGFATLEELLSETSTFDIRGRGTRRQVRLSKELAWCLRKTVNPDLFTGTAVTRPPSSTDLSSSISDTSNAGSIGECTRESPTSLVPLPETSPLQCKNGVASESVSPDVVLPQDNQTVTAPSCPPDPSALPLPMLYFNSKPENGEENACMSKYYDLFSGKNLFSPKVLPRPSSVPENDSCTSEVSNKRKTRLAAHFDLPLCPN